jgi:hypothetical protein
VQKRGRGKSVQPPEDPKPPRTTHKLLQVCLFSNFVLSFDQLSLQGQKRDNHKTLVAKLVCTKQCWFGISSARICESR